MNKMSEDTGAKSPKLKSGGQSAVMPKPEAAPEKREIGGPKGPEPTRYGDWEKNGRCTDF